MNMMVGRQALSAVEIERMCVAYLRMLPASQHVRAVSIVGRQNSSRNWAVVSIDPPLSTMADNEARNVLVELQREFLLAD
jgi:hypothetical protein